MEIQQLKHLIAAAKYGNLLKAAEVSNITQSGLSRSITSLELRLGVPLLIRKPKGVELTQFGECVMQRAEVIVNEVARSLDDIRAMEGGRVGKVSFGVTQNFAMYLIPSVLAQLQIERPDIHFNIVTGGFLEMTDQVRHGNIDFAFGLFGGLGTDPDLCVEPLKDHYSRVIGRVDHPLSRRKDIQPAELAQQSWAILAGGFRRNFIAYFEDRNLRAPQQVLTVDSVVLISRFIMETDAIAVLPPNVVMEEINSGRAAIIDCEPPAEATFIGLITRKTSPATPPVKLVIDRIKAAVHLK